MRGREGIKRIDGILRKQGSREVIKALRWIESEKRIEKVRELR